MRKGGGRCRAGMDLGCELEEGAEWPLPPQPCGVIVSVRAQSSFQRCGRSARPQLLIWGLTLVPCHRQLQHRSAASKGGVEHGCANGYLGGRRDSKLSIVHRDTLDGAAQPKVPAGRTRKSFLVPPGDDAAGSVVRRPAPGPGISNIP